MNVRGDDDENKRMNERLFTHGALVNGRNHKQQKIVKPLQNSRSESFNTIITKK